MSGSKRHRGETVRLSEDAVTALQQLGGHERPASLIVYHRHGAEAVTLAREIVIGREKPSTMVIPDPSLSRQHARFSMGSGGVVVEDLGSTNGTRYQGKRISQRALAPGEQVAMGGVVVAVHDRGPGGELAGLMGQDHFHRALGREMVRVRFFDRKLTVAFVRNTDKKNHLSSWSRELQSRLRPIDEVAFYSSDALEVLLPELNADEAEALLTSVLGNVDGNVDARIDVLCGLASYPDSATTGDELLALCRQAARAAHSGAPIRQARTDGSHTVPPSSMPEQPIVESAGMKQVFDLVGRVAKSAMPILLHGETGVGKEVVARTIHDAGPRGDKPMVCVNCGAIPAQLVESTLFGHEKGAFTGASQKKHGVFEAADGGTVLLDEIGELPADAQVALLRVLESKRVQRIGANEELQVDVRVVAATHRDLEAMVEKGEFRRDLLYRLNALTIEIPPLRERREEIPLFVRRFLKEANEVNGCNVRGTNHDALAKLVSYSWPGNVRELRNAIERAVVIARGDMISVEDLPVRVGQSTGKAAASVSGGATDDTMDGGYADLGPEDENVDFKTRVQRYEAHLIVDALRQCSWKQTDAARQLHMPLRTLVHKMKTYGIKKLGYGAD